MFRVSVIAQTARPLAPQVARQLRRAHRRLKPRPKLADLSVVLVGDARMRSLHNRYMGIDRPTDVLSFELDHDARGNVLAGEVIVCVPEARRQAKRRGTGALNETLLYALHGMLHLCGFDDKTDAGFNRMHRMEDKILTQLGVGAVFGMAGSARALLPRKQGKSS
ncbi:hypothetical protein BH09PLA1_BH09PLA1_34810 [soil metagenome]